MASKNVRGKEGQQPGGSQNQRRADQEQTNVEGKHMEGGPKQEEDLDDIDFENYKGIYANDDHSQKYQCPETGAHFEFNDLCRRMMKMMEKRKVFEDQIYAKNYQQQHSHQQDVQQQYQQLCQPQNANEVFSSSIISEKIDQNRCLNVIPDSQKMLQFKNKFEELVISSQGKEEQTRNPLGKENQYSFIQQKSMKDLSSNQLVSQNTIQGHNKRSSHDKNKNSQIQAMDTYSRLMQMMNERTNNIKPNQSKSINNNMSRGKSGEKPGPKMAQPQIMQASSSQQKLKTYCQVRQNQTTNTFYPGQPSREKSSGHTQVANPSISSVLKSQSKAIGGNGSSRNNMQNGIGGHLNTQNGTKQFMSYYQNKSSLVQNQNGSRKAFEPQQVMCDTGSHKLSSQKSTGAINPKAAPKGTGQMLDSQISINEIMAKYMKQGQHVSGGSLGGDKSRNNAVINSSKTQSESMMRGSNQKQGSRPVTTQGPNQIGIQVNNSIQGNKGTSQNKRKSGGAPDHQSRNTQIGVHQTAQAMAYSMEMNCNDYLKRVESTGSTGPTLISASLLDLQKKIESKIGKSRMGQMGASSTTQQMRNGKESMHGYKNGGSFGGGNYFSGGGVRNN